MSEFLTAADIQAYTRKTHREAQAKVLEADGIPFKWRGRELIVLWGHVRACMEGRPIAAPRSMNMEAIR